MAEQKLALGRIFMVLVILIAVIGGLAYKYIIPKLQESQQAKKYDQASSGGRFDTNVTVAGDPWSGYSLFRSDRFRTVLSQLQIGYRYEQEEDLEKRFQGLVDGKYDFVVATIDGYTLNAINLNYPGVIIFLVDESNGGDSIVASSENQALDDLEGARISYSAGFPSEHLLDVTLTHFDILSVKRMPVTKGLSEKSYQMLKQGQVEAAVVWEPETSRAIQEGYTLLTSTKDSDDIIIDVCIASRQIVTSNPQIVQKVTRAYFKTLDYYQKRESEFVQYLAEDGGPNIDEATAQHILDGIDFIDLRENHHLWFGIGQTATDKIAKVIEDTISVQQFHDKLLTDPFASKPGGAYWIVNKDFLSQLTPSAAPQIKGMPEKEVAPPPVETKRQFVRMKAEEIESKTQRIGEMRVDPIYFGSGSAKLSQQSKLVVDKFADTFLHYPNYRLILHGYSSPTGSPQINMDLSRKRAGSIAQYLVRKHNVQGSRINTVAHGDREPLKRDQNEAYADWLERNQRTDFVLVKDR